MQTFSVVAFALLALGACGSVPDPAPQPDGGAAHPPEQPVPEPAPVPYQDGEDDAYGGPCEPGIEYMIEDLEITVPVACDPFWLDLGDPAPGEPAGTV